MSPILINICDDSDEETDSKLGVKSALTQFNSIKATPETLVAQCNMCNNVFGSTVLFVNHMQNFHGFQNLFECTLCHQIFNCEKGLQYHNITVHMSSNDSYLNQNEVHLCEICDESFSVLEALNAHKAVHASGDKSSVNQTFQSPVPKYTCSICQKSFFVEKVLLWHEQKKHALKKKHNIKKKTVKPKIPEYPCNLCNEIFTRKYILNAHLKIDHIQPKKIELRKKLVKSVKKSNYFGTRSSSLSDSSNPVVCSSPVNKHGREKPAITAIIQGDTSAENSENSQSSINESQNTLSINSLVQNSNIFNDVDNNEVPLINNTPYQCAFDQHTLDQLVCNQRICCQPSSDQSATDVPSPDQPFTSWSLSNQTAFDQPLASWSSSNQPASDQPLTSWSPSNQTTSDQPLTSWSSSNQPVSDQPLTSWSSSNQPVSDQPLTSWSSSNHHASDQLATAARSSVPAQPAANTQSVTDTQPATYSQPSTDTQPDAAAQPIIASQRATIAPFASSRDASYQPIFNSSFIQRVNNQPTSKPPSYSQLTIDQSGTEQPTSNPSQVKIREKLFCCKYCIQKFKLLYLSLQHVETHDIEKPEICLVCSKSFVLNSNLIDHILLEHDMEPLFSCPACEKPFKNWSHCKKHVRLTPCHRYITRHLS